MSTTVPDDTVRPRVAWYLLVAVLWAAFAVVVARWWRRSTSRSQIRTCQLTTAQGYGDPTVWR